MRARLCLLLLVVLVGAGMPAPAAAATHASPAPLVATAPAGGQPAAAALAAPAGPKRITTRFGILVDARSGAVLWSRSATAARAPASLTKMLTALLVRATLPLNAVAVTTRDAARTPPSKLALKPGQKITVGQALQALMIVSANDMAVLLAHSSAGSVARFERAMDAESRLLGLRQSSWRSTNGLDAPGHRSSAFDLAILARAVLLDPWLARVVRAPKVIFTTPDGHRHELYPHSHFLSEYRGAIGVKTGFTDGAGRCLAAAATRNGRTLIAVVLHSADPVGDAGRLMDWGFGPGRNVSTGASLPPYVAPMGVRTLLTPAPTSTTSTTLAPPAAAPGSPGAASTQLRDRLARWPAGNGAAAGAGAAGVALLGGIGLARRRRRRAVPGPGTMDPASGGSPAGPTAPGGPEGTPGGGPAAD
jgi:D-alanyl-D-alanine carboxypeptidase (penicillin-binding protein 5/6)